MIQAFKQLSSPSAQRVYDVSPLLDHYVGEDLSESPTSHRNYILKSMDSAFAKTEMIGRKSSEMEEDEFKKEKKLKAADEVIPAAGTSAQGSIAPIVANNVVAPVTVKELSAPVTKKNFNAMVLESGILDGKWNRSDLILLLLSRKIVVSSYLRKKCFRILLLKKNHAIQLATKNGHFGDLEKELELDAYYKAEAAQFEKEALERRVAASKAEAERIAANRRRQVQQEFYC